MIRLGALIVGGGPAGCSCAIWLQQLGVGVAIVERKPHLGGLQAESPYANRWIAGVLEKTGVELARDLDAHVRALEVPVLRCAQPRRIARAGSGFQVDVDAGGTSTAVACEQLVLATGVEPRTGGIAPGPGVVFGPGLSIERHDFAGRSVAILGGGDNAAENYGILRAKSPARLVLFARTLRARPALLARVPAEAIRVGDYRVDPERRAVTLDGREEAFDALVVLYGWRACIPDAVFELDPALADARGFVATDAQRRTRVPGLWAIGEVAQASHPCCVTAMADGVVCAKAIEAQALGDAARGGVQGDRLHESP